MSDGTFDLYLIQNPAGAMGEEYKGYNKGLLKAYDGSIRIYDIQDFINRVVMESVRRGRKIGKLVIGSHGAGLPTGYGHFYLGKSIIDKDEHSKLNSLAILRNLFAKDAHVYIMACQTGRDALLLRMVSQALGGVAVHGYTDYITTTDLGLFATVDDGTDDEGTEIVCWPSWCRDNADGSIRPSSRPPIIVPRTRR